MARELSGYRDLLELIRDMYPERTALNVEEAARALGVHRQTITAAIMRRSNPLPAQNISKGQKYKTYIIPITALARWQCGGI